MASVTLSSAYPYVGAGPGAKTEVAEALSELSEAGDSLLLRLPDCQPAPPIIYVLPLELSAHSFWLQHLLQGVCTFPLQIDGHLIRGGQGAPSPLWQKF